MSFNVPNLFGILSICFLSACSTAGRPPRHYFMNYGSELRPDILTFSKPSPQTIQKINVRSINLNPQKLNQLAALPRTNTTLGWMLEEKPDTLHFGPWNTRLYLFENGDPNHCIRVELLNHHGRVDTVWLSAKLLFVEVWFGRIAWTDFILDTEKARIIYMEDGRLDQVNDKNLTVNGSQK